MSILNVENLSHGFGDRTIFTNVSFRLLKGEHIGLVGANGEGKSTFLNALLGKNILPSGITPITAKICHIVYGQDYALEIHYKNGNTATKTLSYLNEVSEVQNAKIAFYKLYAPLELLKKISFLDTPGFNSQNQSDTDTTNSILESVDGIIWLTLIDNVGKHSEKEIILSHIKRYASKSLCVLNQKDRLKNQEEINISLEYAKKAFNGLFEEIIGGLPSKEAYQSSFYMRLKVTAFPGFAAPDGISPSIAADLEKSWQDSVVSTALAAIETTIGQGFSLLGKAAKTYEAQEKVMGKTLNAMARFSSDLAWKNVFQNPLLTSLGKKMKTIVDADKAEDKATLVEEALVDIWAYSKEQNIVLDASATPFGGDGLDIMLHARELAHANQMSIGI